MYGYYYFDPTYLLLVIGMVLSLLASAKVKSTFLFTAECAVHRGLQAPMLPDGFFVCRELRMLR